MVAAAKLGETMGYTERGTAKRIAALLEKFGLPTAIEASPETYQEAMRLDKKSLGDTLRFVFLDQIGRARAIPLPKETLFRHLGG